MITKLRVLALTSALAGCTTGGAIVSGVVGGGATAVTVANDMAAGAQITESLLCGGFGGFYNDVSNGTVKLSATSQSKMDAIANLCSSKPAPGSTDAATLLALWNQLQDLEKLYKTS